MTDTLNISTYLKQYPFLTRQEFEIAAKSFLEQSRNSDENGGDLWVWNEHEVDKKYIYFNIREEVILPLNFLKRN